MKIKFNLLPLQQKEHLRIQQILRSILEQEIYITIVFGVLTLSLFGIYFILKSEAGLLKAVEEKFTEQSGYQEITSIHEEFKDVHQVIKDVTKTLDGHVNWSRVLIMLSENVDEQIIIESITTTDNQMQIHAIAKTREDVISLKEKFREVKRNEQTCFENIVVPESDLALPKNVSFTMTLDVNVACLR